MDVMSREQTLEFLQTHVKTEMLMKHLYAVETLVRSYDTWPGMVTVESSIPGSCALKAPTSDGPTTPRYREHNRNSDLALMFRRDNGDD